MKTLKYIIILILFIIATIWSYNLRDPHLLPFRDYEIVSLLILFILTSVLALLLETKILCYSILFLSIILMTKTVITESYFLYVKSNILNTPSYLHRLINKQLIIGFNDISEIEKLSINGIAGIYITKRNIKGKSLTEVRHILSQLQLKRKQAGLPPLIITTDQEGGPVSRLSPLIEQQPALNSLVSRDNSSDMAFEYGKKQGKLLKNIGINVNFGPVVDLMPIKPVLALDFHTQINTRAISDSPQKIIQIALPYIKGLERNGITATLKHFPGLGKVNSDTHHFSAELEVPVADLITKDWLPFTILSSQTNSWIMLSHVTLNQVDQLNPVSTSKIVVDNIIRKQLGFTGILITDDLTMGATYNRGFCKSVLGAYNADIDYLLIAYDYEKYYDLIHCIEQNIEKLYY